MRNFEDEEALLNPSLKSVLFFDGIAWALRGMQKRFVLESTRGNCPCCGETIPTCRHALGQ